MIVGALELQLYADVARLARDMNQAQQAVGGAMAKIDRAAAVAKGALLGLGAVGLGAALLASVRSAIDLADNLGKLSQRTGVAVEALSQLQYAAALSGVANETLATGIKKLNVSIADGIAGDKAKVATFKSLGITLTDAAGRAKTADAVLLEMADAFAKARDGAGKTAAAVQLLGKAGDEMIPLLNGGSAAIRALMKEADQLGLTISTDFAKQAEEFNDNLSRVQTQSQKTAILFAGEFVAGLGKAMKAMADATIEGGRLAGIVAGLQTLLTGDDRHKANVMIVDLTDQILGSESALEKARARGDAANTARLTNRVANLRKELSVHQGFATQMDADAEKAAAAAKKLEEERKKGAELRTGETKADKAAAEALKARQKAEEERMKFGRAYAIAQADDFAAGNKAEAESIKDAHKAIDDFFSSKRKGFEQNQAIADQADALLSNIRFEIEALSMTNVEREKSIALRALEATGLDTSSEKYKQLAIDIQAAVEQREAVRAHKEIWESIDRTAHDTFVNVFDSGSNAFKKLGQTLKASVLDLLYQMTIKQWIIQLSTSGTGQGISGLASSAVGGAGNSMLTSMGTSALGGLGMATGANAVGFSAGLGTTMGQLGAVGANVANAGTLAAGGSWMGALGAVAPYLAAAIAIIALFSKDGGGPKVDGQAGAFGNANTLTGQIQSGQFGGNSLGGALAPSVQALQAQYDDRVRAFGGTTGTTFGLGVSRDPKGDANTMLEAIAKDASGNTLFSNLNKSVGRSDEDLKNALSVAAVDSLIGALKASDIGPEFKKFFDAVAADASLEEKTAALQKANNLLLERMSLEERLFQLTATDLEKLNRAREAERAAIDESNKALLERIYVEEDRRLREEKNRTDLVAAYNSESSAMQDTIDRHQDYADSLRAFMKQLTMGPEAMLTPERQYMANKAEFQRVAAAAAGGDETALQQFQGVSEAFLQASQQYYASSGMYFVDLAAVKGATEAAAIHAEATVDVERLQLTAMQSQLTALGLLNTTAKSFTELLQQYLSAQGTTTSTTSTGSSTFIANQAALAARTRTSSSGGTYIGGMVPTLRAFTAGESSAFWGIPGHASGLMNVPYDNYLMRAHAGEAVLNRSEAMDWRGGMGGREVQTLLSEMVSRFDRQLALTSAVGTETIGLQREMTKGMRATTNAGMLARASTKKGMPA